jgi:hypothetical protein
LGEEFDEKCLPMISELIQWADFVVLHYISSPGLFVEAIKDVKHAMWRWRLLLTGSYYNIAYDNCRPGDIQISGL